MGSQSGERERTCPFLPPALWISMSACHRLAAARSQLPWEPVGSACSRGEEERVGEERSWGRGTPAALSLEHGSSSSAMLRPWGRRQRSTRSGS